MTRPQLSVAAAIRAFEQAPAVRREQFLVRVFASLCARPASIGAAAGRSEDLLKIFDALDPTAQRDLLFYFISQIPNLAPAAYRSFDDNNPVQRFLRERTYPKFGARSQSSILHKAYLAWADRHGAPHLTNTSFARELGRLELTKLKSSVTFWIEVALLPDDAEAAE